MKIKSRILCLCLALCILFGITSGMSLVAFAAQNATTDFVAGNYDGAQGTYDQEAFWFPGQQDTTSLAGVRNLRDGNWIRFDEVTFTGSEKVFSFEYSTDNGNFYGNLDVYINEIKASNLIASARNVEGGEYGWLTVKTNTADLSKRVKPGTYSVYIVGCEATLKGTTAANEQFGIRSFRFQTGDWGDTEATVPATEVNATDEFIASAHTSYSGVGDQEMAFPGDDSSKAIGIANLKDGNWAQYDNVVFTGNEKVFSFDYGTQNDVYKGNFDVYINEIKTANLIVAARDLVGGDYNWPTVKNHTAELQKRVSAGTHSVIIVGRAPTKLNEETNSEGDIRFGLRSFRFQTGDWGDTEATVPVENDNAADEFIASEHSEAQGVGEQEMAFPGDDSSKAIGIANLKDGNWARYDDIIFTGSEKVFSFDYGTENSLYYGNFDVYINEIKTANRIVTARNLEGGEYNWPSVKNHTAELQKRVSAGTHSVIIVGRAPTVKPDQTAVENDIRFGLRSFRFQTGDWGDTSATVPVTTKYATNENWAVDFDESNYLNATSNRQDMSFPGGTVDQGINDMVGGHYLKYNDIVFTGNETTFSIDYTHNSANSYVNFNVYLDSVSTDNLIVTARSKSTGLGWMQLGTLTFMLSEPISGTHAVIIEGLDNMVHTPNTEYEPYGRVAGFYAFRFIEGTWAMYSTFDRLAVDYDAAGGANGSAWTPGEQDLNLNGEKVYSIGDFKDGRWLRFDDIVFTGNEAGLSFDFMHQSDATDASFNIYYDELSPENLIASAVNVDSGQGWGGLATATVALDKRVPRGTHKVIIEGLTLNNHTVMGDWRDGVVALYAFRFIDGPAPLNVKLDTGKTSPFNNGIFEGFGTSLAWAANYIGKNETLTQETTRLLFGDDADSLMLNIARYNIGGGDDPTHYVPKSEGGQKHITRDDSWDVEGFMNADGSYDWTRDSAQRLFLTESLKENPDLIVEGFSNSPPYFMTVSGCTGGHTVATNDNIADYAAFADYLAAVAKHFRDEWGITFASLSPINEPASGYWQALNNKQEGSQTNQGTAQSTMFTELDRAMKAQGIREDILIAGAEETSINQARDGLNKLSSEALAAIDRVNTHSYSGDDRTDLKDVAEAKGKGLWMSETDGDWLEAGTGDMTAALGFSKQIMKDMNEMMPSAWVTWQAIEGSDYPDGTQNESDGYWSMGVADVLSEDDVYLYKKYYAFGQFTRYIRPGYKVIGSSDDTLAAYDPGSGRIVVVAVNADANSRGIDINMSDFETVGATAQVIRTTGASNGDENWAVLEPITLSGKTLTTELKSNSITTFVVNPGTTSETYIFRATSSDGAAISEDVGMNLTDENTDYYATVFENDDESRLTDVIINSLTGTFPENEGEGIFYTFKMMGFDKASQSPVSEAFANGGGRFKPGSQWGFTETTVRRTLSVSAEKPIAVTGEEVAFTATCEPVQVGDITWIVTLTDGSETTDATITSDGKFTATAGGEYVVKAASASNPDLWSTMTFTAIGASDFVTMTAKLSGLAADTENRVTVNGTKVVQKTGEGYETSLWSLTPVEGKTNVYTIRNRNNGQYLTASTDTTDIVITDTAATDETAVQWELVPCEGRYFRLKNVRTGKYMVVYQYSKAENAQFIQDTWANGDNGLFELARYDGRVKN